MRNAGQPPRHLPARREEVLCAAYPFVCPDSDSSHEDHVEPDHHPVCKPQPNPLSRFESQAKNDLSIIMHEMNKFTE